MDDSKLVEQTEESIRTGLRDYFAHTTQTAIYADVSDEFIERLARDAVKAKRNLRELLRRSTAWDEGLQAVVINGTRTHNPDNGLIHNLAYRILDDALVPGNMERYTLIQQAIRFFDNSDRETGIEAIKELAPDAYKPHKKKSRVFKSLCDALGVTDETPGSQFQQLFAQIADEMNSKKIDFKLFLSINPTHFLTMSNPKDDLRGEMLTSCHSFNVTDHPYNVGCVGYARDNVTMISFVVDNPDKPELLNNRKTMRQLFMYRSGGGLLLQSRLYNSTGGTYGKQKDSQLYRDLVQREISEVEGVVNLWKTEKYIGNKHGVTLRAGRGFGGYTDWTYEDFNANISIHVDRLDDFEDFKIGTYGLCICCATEISANLYCDDCESGDHYKCEECGDRCSQLYQVHDISGECIDVCESCLNEQYERCVECGEYFHTSNVRVVSGGEAVCENCFERHYECCDDCGEGFRIEDGALHLVHDQDGSEIYVCESCYNDRYEYCEHCDESYHYSCMNTAHDENGDEIRVCDDCLEEMHEDSEDDEE